MIASVNVGDVIAVRTGGWAGAVIRFGEHLRGLPDGDNHVVIAHHRDTAGVWWGVEGRPGGVGWADLRPYLRSRWSVSNAEQPRTPQQRVTVAASVEALLGTPYDWDAIFADAMHDLGIPDLFCADWSGRGAPGHVVCSTVAAWAHDKAGLPRPDPGTGGRFIQPADWTRFDETKGWASGRR